MSDGEMTETASVLAELQKLRAEVAQLRGQNTLITKTAADQGVAQQPIKAKGVFAFLGEITRNNRAAKAVEARKQGFSWDEVAEAVGYRTGACAHTRARTHCLDNNLSWPITIIEQKGNADKRRIRKQGEMSGRREYELYGSLGPKASWELVSSQIGEVGYHGTYRRAQKYALSRNLPFPPVVSSSSEVIALIGQDVADELEEEVSEEELEALLGTADDYDGEYDEYDDEDDSGG